MAHYGESHGWEKALGVHRANGGLLFPALFSLVLINLGGEFGVLDYYLHCFCFS